MKVQLAGRRFETHASLRLCCLYPFKAPFQKINLLNGYQAQLSMQLQEAVGSL